MARHCYKRYSNDLHRNGRNENFQPVSVLPTARRINRGGIPLTPPPPIVPRTVPTEEDALVTPPPPYTPSIIHSEVENNGPITPPPPYTPSIIHSEVENNGPITPPPVYTTR